MHNTSEWPSGAVVYLLSQILEVNVPHKYFLSPKAAAGILRRAEARGRALPQPLHEALERLAAGERMTQTSLPRSPETESELAGQTTTKRKRAI